MTPTKPTTKVAGIRERNRLELTAEILQAARSHLIEHGPADLSLRAITRELGMSSSAIYRYFTSRDELLTALIIEAYNDLADHVEIASQPIAGCHDDIASVWTRISHALRNWALTNPQRWALIYGTPIVGYAAPDDTIAAATRVTAPMMRALSDSSDSPEPTGDYTMLNPGLQSIHSQLGISLSEQRLTDGLGVLAATLGLINLELFGHFTNVVADLEQHFSTHVAAAASRLVGEQKREPPRGG